MRKRYYVLLGLLVITGGIVSQLPLSWIGPKTEIAGKVPNYSGTIWRGFVTGTDAGTVEVTTSFGRLVTGKNPVHLSGGPPGLSIYAEAGMAGVRAVKAEGSMKALALQDPRLGLVNGDFRIDVPDMELMEICEYANGTVWTDFLARNSARLRWKGPELEGPVSCEEGRIVLDMTGKDNAADITAKIIIGLDGSYTTNITADVADPMAGLALKFFGFHKAGNGYQLTEQGRWQ